MSTGGSVSPAEPKSSSNLLARNNLGYLGSGYLLRGGVGMGFTWKSALPLQQRLLSFTWQVVMPLVIVLLPVAIVGYLMSLAQM